jgi:hypothetical protein
VEEIKSMAIEKSIFIVGCPRSGTTLLQSLLACSPETSNFPESHLYSSSFRKVGESTLPWGFRYREVSEAFYRRIGIGVEWLPEAPKWFAGFSVEKRSDYLARCLKNAAIAKRAVTLLEKTPHHLWFIEQIGNSFAKLDTQTHFVHMVRDGIETAASLSNASQGWRRPYTPAEALQRWQQDIAQSYKYRYSDGHYFVAYHDLLSDPHGLCKALATRIGISLTDTDLTARESVLQDIVRPDETWKYDQENGRIARRDRAGAYLSVEQEEQLRRQLVGDKFEKIMTRRFCSEN